MDENNSIQLFEDRKIRTAWDCGQTAKPGGAVGKRFAVLWERPVLFH